MLNTVRKPGSRRYGFSPPCPGEGVAEANSLYHLNVLGIMVNRATESNATKACQGSLEVVLGWLLGALARRVHFRNLERRAAELPIQLRFVGGEEGQLQRQRRHRAGFAVAWRHRDQIGRAHV